MIFLTLTEGLGNSLTSIFLIQTYLIKAFVVGLFFSLSLGNQFEKWCCNIPGRNARNRESSSFHPLQSNSQIISQRIEPRSPGDLWSALAGIFPPSSTEILAAFWEVRKVICFSVDIKRNQSMPGKPQEKQLKETMIQWSKIHTDQLCSFPHFH